MKIKHITAAVFSLMIAALFFSVTSFAEGEELRYDIFTYTVRNHQATITSIDAAGLKKVYIPEEIDGNIVSAIGYSMRIQTNTSFELYIPSTVNYFPDFSVDEFTRISAFFVDSGNEYFSSDEYGALYDKPKEMLIIFPRAAAAKNYIAPDSLKTINDYAFNYCKNIETVTLNSGIERINRFAFYGATKLKSINFPDGLTYIGEDAFIRCYSLEKVVLPDSVTDIGGSAFSECTSLKELVFPEKTTALLTFVAADDLALERVILPAGVTSVESLAFYNCPKLKHIYFKGSEAQWNGIPGIENAESIKDAVIHFNYEPSDAFDGIDFDIANGIMYVSGSDTVPDTKENNFFFFEEQKESVTTIIFNGIAYVGNYAFDNYPNLVNAIVCGTGIKIAENAFRNCPRLETVLFFEDADFHPSAFNDGSKDLRVFANQDKTYPEYDKIIPYQFENGTLAFKGNVRLNRYEFFDTIAAFCLEFDNIEKLKFEKLEFEDIGLYYYPDDASEPVLIEGNSLEEGEITVYITENGVNRNISFNALIEGIEDESITEFLLSATDKNHAQTRDTVFNVITKAVLRALKWVVSLMNKVFNLIGKK